MADLDIDGEVEHIELKQDSIGTIKDDPESSSPKSSKPPKPRLKKKSSGGTATGTIRSLGTLVLQQMAAEAAAEKAEPRMHESEAMEQHKRLNMPDSIWRACKDGTVRDFLKAFENLEDPKKVYEKGPHYGESILHVACLFSNHEMIYYLVENFPDLLNEPYGCPNKMGPFDGETALHIAIVHADVELVEFLLEKGARVDCKVTGGFFSGAEDFGETPIGFAVCLERPERKEIIRKLLLKGARLDAIDKNGNNLLHIAILKNSVEMYTYILDLFELYRTNLWNSRPKKTRVSVDEVRKSLEQTKSLDASRESVADIEPEIPITFEDYHLEKMRNNEKRTPLTFAAAKGRSKILERILQRRKVILWIYGPTSQSAYPLSEIDTFKEDPKDPSTALMLIIYTNPDSTSEDAVADRANLLKTTPIWELIVEKWEKFAKFCFYMSLGFYFIFLFFVCCMILPQTFIPALACEVIVLVNVIITMFEEIADIRRLKKRYFTEKGSVYFYILSWTYSILFAVGIPLRFAGREASELIFNSLGALVAFLYLLYYARGFQFVGYYVVMIREMLFNDVSRFVSIYILFVLGFGIAFVNLFRTTSDTFLGSIDESLLSLIHITLFDLSVVDYTSSNSPLLVIFLMICFALMTGVLMLNLLIAMMNDTYSKIRASAEDQWKLEWASIILLMERRYAPFFNGKVGKFLFGDFSERFRSGLPGPVLGIANQGRYFVVKESVPWESLSRKKKLGLLLRHAIQRIILQLRSLRAINSVFGGTIKAKKEMDFFEARRKSMDTKKKPLSKESLSTNLEDPETLNLVRRASKRLSLHYRPKGEPPLDDGP